MVAMIKLNLILMGSIRHGENNERLKVNSDSELEATLLFDFLTCDNAHHKGTINLWNRRVLKNQLRAESHKCC